MIVSDTLDDNDEGAELGMELIALDEVHPPSERSKGDDDDNDDGNGNTDDGNNRTAGNEVCRAFDAEAGTTTTATATLESDDGGTNDDGQDGKIETGEGEGEGEGDSDGDCMVDLDKASGNGKAAFWWNASGMKEVPNRGTDPLLDLRDENKSVSFDLVWFGLI